MTPVVPPVVPPIASPRPPRLAERALTWSLPTADREAVLGDLQEEFAAVAATSGHAAAWRWYWTQTLTSASANIERRIRLALEQRRLEESDSDRMTRRAIRNFSLWLVGGPIALGLIVWLQDADLSILVLFVPIVYIGLLLLVGNLWPRPTTDAQTAARQARRARLFTTIVFLGSIPRFFLYPAHRHLLLEINVVELILGLATLFWPKEWWPIRPSWMPPEERRAQNSR